jgi:hypothetical protein
MTKNALQLYSKLFVNSQTRAARAARAACIEKIFDKNVCVAKPDEKREIE